MRAIRCSCASRSFNGAAQLEPSFPRVMNLFFSFDSPPPCLNTIGYLRSLAMVRLHLSWTPISYRCLLPLLFNQSLSHWKSPLHILSFPSLQNVSPISYERSLSYEHHLHPFPLTPPTWKDHSPIRRELTIIRASPAWSESSLS